MLACRLPPPAYSPRPKTGHLSAKGTERPDTTSPRIERIGQFWGECITQIGSFQWLSKYFQSPERGPAASWAPPVPACPVLLDSASVYLVPSHSADCYSKCSRISTTDSFTFVAVSAGLSGVALLACWIPAMPAARADPLDRTISSLEYPIL